MDGVVFLDALQGRLSFDKTKAGREPAVDGAEGTAVGAGVHRRRREAVVEQDAIKGVFDGDLFRRAFHVTFDRKLSAVCHNMHKEIIVR